MIRRYKSDVSGSLEICRQLKLEKRKEAETDKIEKKKTSTEEVLSGSQPAKYPTPLPC